MFCLQSRQHFFVHKQFWPHYICFITNWLLDHFSSYPVYFLSTDISSKYFFIQCHASTVFLSHTSFIFLRWWSDD
jgi:hypothetical protein